jgi:hypothetical protein
MNTVGSDPDEAVFMYPRLCRDDGQDAKRPAGSLPRAFAFEP